MAFRRLVTGLGAGRGVKSSRRFGAGGSSAGGMIIGGRTGGIGGVSALTETDFLRRRKKPEGFFCRPWDELVCREGGLLLALLGCTGDAFGGVGRWEVEVMLLVLLLIVTATLKGELMMEESVGEGVDAVWSRLLLEAPPNMRRKKPCFSFGCETAEVGAATCTGSFSLTFS